jgi:uncharacterized membrane protein YqaE (UPF0057 family)
MMLLGDSLRTQDIRLLPCVRVIEGVSTVLYLVAILLPPLAVLLCGKPFQALLNCLLTLCFYVPGLIHALLVVQAHKADQRQRALIEAMGGTVPKPRSFRLSR